MTPIVARFRGLALVLVLVLAATVVGVLIGRVIESLAVGAVLVATWTSVRRLLPAPGDERDGPAHDRAR